MSLRVMILAMGWWVALSLGSVGTPLWIWAGGAVLLSGAHAFSWYFRTLRSPIRSLVVVAGLLATLALVPTTVRHVLGGDWLPVAYFLLLFLIITALEIRSRGGLDASAALSGVILFVVSQRALDVTFGVFLVGFITLLLAYFAMSFLVDQVRQAEVRWFRSPFSFAYFWVVVLIVTLVVSAGIFVFLPKHVADPIGGAQAVALPEGARPSGRLLDNESEAPGPMGSALPVGSSNEPERVNGAGDAVASGVEDALPAGEATTAGGQPDGAGGGPPSSVDDAARAQGADPVGIGSGTGEESAQPVGSGAGEQGTSAAAPRAGSGSAARPEGQGGGPGAEDPLVMQVRSPVLTYWRGRVFDRFDGDGWSTDLDLWAPGRRRSGSYAIGFQELGALQGRLRYSQIYFLRQSAPLNIVFAGYAPVTASVSSSGDDASRLEEGSVYRVISALPDFGPDALTGADPRT